MTPQRTLWHEQWQHSASGSEDLYLMGVKQRFMNENEIYKLREFFLSQRHKISVQSLVTQQGSRGICEFYLKNNVCVIC